MCIKLNCRHDEELIYLARSEGAAALERLPSAAAPRALTALWSLATTKLLPVPGPVAALPLPPGLFLLRPAAKRPFRRRARRDWPPLRATRWARLRLLPSQALPCSTPRWQSYSLRAAAPLRPPSLAVALLPLPPLRCPLPLPPRAPLVADPSPSQPPLRSHRCSLAPHRPAPPPAAAAAPSPIFLN